MKTKLSFRDRLVVGFGLVGLVVGGLASGSGIVAACCGSVLMGVVLLADWVSRVE
ncbi:MAG: hypothetical protein JRN62_03805 [Nitrososphaerota archaeon]|jgi:hypothetical protein|nr:hypothetical protein [Nitrososphaerota archaeon]MDG6948727.1 hypothetical protein [Nitrososphaerota archaeon]